VNHATGKLRVAVVGVGHLGRNHARIFTELDETELVAIADISSERGRTVSQAYGVPLVENFRDLPKIDAVSIAVPTILHDEVGSFFLKNGTPALIEKPLAKTMQEAHALCELAESTDTLLQVGHIERFNPVILALEPLVQHPRFIQFHRIRPFSFRSMDIGVVMDLMIHDIDILLHLVSSRVVSVEAMGAKILSRTEDIANARLVFENGCVADITASRVSTKHMRELRIFQEGGYITVDYERKSGRMFTLGPKAGEMDLEKMADEGVDDPMAYVFSDLIRVKELEIMDEEPLKAELRSFACAVAAAREPVVTGKQGARAMRIAEWILRSLDENLKKL